jgi:hypothetical protein
MRRVINSKQGRERLHEIAGDMRLGKTPIHKMAYDHKDIWPPDDVHKDQLPRQCPPDRADYQHDSSVGLGENNEPPMGATQHLHFTDDLGPDVPSGGRDKEPPRFSAPFGSQRVPPVRGVRRGRLPADLARVPSAASARTWRRRREHRRAGILPRHARARQWSIGRRRSGRDFAALYPKAWSPTMGGRRSEYDRMKEEIDFTVATKRRARASQLAQDISIAESGFFESDEPSALH